MNASRKISNSRPISRLGEYPTVSLSSRNSAESLYIRVYIYRRKYRRGNSSNFCQALVQASLKRRVESEPVAVYLRRSGARGRGTRRGERGDVERDTGPECLFSNEDGTGRFGSGSIRWTQHWKILLLVVDTWVLIPPSFGSGKFAILPSLTFFNPPPRFPSLGIGIEIGIVIVSDRLSLSFPLISSKFEFQRLSEVWKNTRCLERNLCTLVFRTGVLVRKYRIRRIPISIPVWNSRNSRPGKGWIQKEGEKEVWLLISKRFRCGGFYSNFSRTRETVDWLSRRASRFDSSPFSPDNRSGTRMDA